MSLVQKFAPYAATAVILLTPSFAFANPNNDGKEAKADVAPITWTAPTPAAKDDDPKTIPSQIVPNEDGRFTYIQGADHASSSVAALMFSKETQAIVILASGTEQNINQVVAGAVQHVVPKIRSELKNITHDLKTENNIELDVSNTPIYIVEHDGLKKGGGYQINALGSGISINAKDKDGNLIKNKDGKVKTIGTFGPPNVLLAAESAALTAAALTAEAKGIELASTNNAKASAVLAQN